MVQRQNGEDGSPEPVPDRDGFGDRLAKARARQGLDRPPAQPDGGRGLGLRAGTEAAAAIGVGTLIGVLLDRWLGTSPVLLLVFLLLGCAAALRNLMRLVAGSGTGAGRNGAGKT